MAKEKGGRKPRRRKEEAVEPSPDAIDSSPSPHEPIQPQYPIGQTLDGRIGWYCKDDLRKEPGTAACTRSDDLQAYEHADCGSKSGLPIRNLDMTLEQLGAYEDSASRVVDMAKTHPYVKEDLARRLGFSSRTQTPEESKPALDERTLALELQLLKYTVGLVYIASRAAHQRGWIKYTGAVAGFGYGLILSATACALSTDADSMAQVVGLMIVGPFSGTMIGRMIDDVMARK